MCGTCNGGGGLRNRNNNFVKRHERRVLKGELCKMNVKKIQDMSC
jgi:hypothetical protein